MSCSTEITVHCTLLFVPHFPCHSGDCEYFVKKSNIVNAL